MRDVPAGLTTQLIHIAHQGHQGMTRTKQRLRQYYWWSSMDKQVEELIRNCVVCSSSDKTAKTYTAPMTPISFPDEPWRKISMDIVGPMDTLPYDCRYAVTLVHVDLHSKWPEIALCPKVTSETVIAFLQKVFCREGQAEEIVTYNGVQFTSAVFEEFLQANNIKYSKSAIYHPETNSNIERFHRVLKDSIQTAKIEQKPIKEATMNFLAIYRNTSHATTGKSPSELLHGRKMRTGLSIRGVHKCSKNNHLTK